MDVRSVFVTNLSTVSCRKIRSNILWTTDGSSPAFIAVMTVEILSMEGFDAAGKEHLPKLFADLPNFSNITPVGQIEEIVS